MAGFKEAAEFVTFRAFSAVFFVLPRRWCLGLGRGLGLLFFHLDGRHRRIALANLRTAFGRELSAAKQYAVARGAFINFSRTLVDLLKLASWSRDRIERLVIVEGRENLLQAAGRGKGVLVLTGHFGNWEMVPIPLSEAAPLWAVARFLDNPFLEKRLLGLRTRLGTRIIYKDRAARQVLQVLRKGEIVIILIDQNVLRIQAVFVDFFGKLAGTTPALAAFHLRTGAPIVPAFCTPEAGGRYRVRIFPAVDTRPEGRNEADVLKITGTCTKIIESQIRQFPEGWLWFHERWKSRPAGEQGRNQETHESPRPRP
jgi:KDO2-lipid IV(A) lauroyltransferase